MTQSKWIGVDFDETLRRYDGSPIETMVARVKLWISQGREVRIITARVCPMDQESAWIHANGGPDQVAFVQNWCEIHIGIRLLVQWGKSKGMLEFWDDKAVRVEANTGRRMSVSAVEGGCGGVCCVGREIL